MSAFGGFIFINTENNVFFPLKKSEKKKKENKKKKRKKEKQLPISTGPGINIIHHRSETKFSDLIRQTAPLKEIF